MRRSLRFALMFAAVTGWPFENFVKPALTVKS